MSPDLARMRTATTLAAVKGASQGKRLTRGRSPPVGCRFLWLPTACLLIAILALSGNSPFDRASCEPAIQRGQPQAQQQSNELTGLQDSSQFSSRAGGDGAPLGEILAALGDKRGPFTNAKRARKMSAFMPMRGRKDGRDLIGLDSLHNFRSGALRHFAPDNFGGGVPLQQQPLDGFTGQPEFGAINQQLGPLRESDPNEASLIRLFNGRATMPRQFFNQLEARAASAQEGAARLAPVGLEQVAETDLMDRGGPQAELSMNSNQMMQAKLRRAFHPMRGKRASMGALSPMQLEDLFTGAEQQSDGDF